MKKNFTPNTPEMATQTIGRRHVARGPRPEILSAIRQFARAYCPTQANLPGLVLN